MNEKLYESRGGGGVLELLQRIFKGCKIPKNCYNSDIYIFTLMMEILE